MVTHKNFWTLTPNGTKILRNLQKENLEFTREEYLNGNFDGNNYQWYEMFHHYINDDIGCDYERYGCLLQPNDVVLDIGANIGIFSFRAEQRGASKVYCFEPLLPTFNCLQKNKGKKTEIFNLGVGSKNELRTFKIHTDFTHIGGGGSDPHNQISPDKIIYEQTSYVVNINDIFTTIKTRIDFMKIDIEGGEVEVLNTISDENLSSLRCLAAEFHYSEGFDDFQNNFIKRMNDLNFNTFILYHGDGSLRTLNCWKK
jgi:FkbM family methyltransferase